jgi:chloramphenicol O-acetyltransferase type B
MEKKETNCEFWSQEKFNNKIGENVIILDGCELSNSTFELYSRVKKYVEFRNSTLGAYSSLSSHAVINATDIGRFCSFAHGIYIGLWEHNTFTSTHSFYLYETSGGFIKGYKNYEKDNIRTNIGHDVWIGAGAFIRKGVTVGSGAIIGAGAVVTKDVEPYSIAVGNPAKLLKYRFEEEDRAMLMQAQWWNFSRDILQDMVDKEVWYSLDALKEYLIDNNLV